MFVYFSVVHYYTVWCYVFVLDESGRLESVQEMLLTLHDVSNYQLAVFNDSSRDHANSGIIF